MSKRTNLMNKISSQYYVTAEVVTQTTSTHQKIFISAKDIQNAFEVEQQLLTQKTVKIMNIRHTKYRPRLKTTHKNYIEIKGIEDLDV